MKKASTKRRRRKVPKHIAYWQMLFDQGPDDTTYRNPGKFAYWQNVFDTNKIAALSTEDDKVAEFQHQLSSARWESQRPPRQQYEDPRQWFADDADLAGFSTTSSIGGLLLVLGLVGAGATALCVNHALKD